MGQTVELPWGAGSLKVLLPETWSVLGELKPRSHQAASDPAKICAEALQNPIGMKPLASRELSGQRVVLVVDDHSRPTPVREFIQPVLHELTLAGVKDENIDIIIATGVHRPSRAEEVERKLGMPRRV
jgi:nickel-dependent lactate racemase